MKTKDLLALILCLLTLACTGKKQTLDDKVENDTKKIEKTSAAVEKVDTLIAAPIVTPGIKYRESRKIDPQNPPIVIDIEKAAEDKDFDLNQYYSDVEYIKLNHPLAGQKKGFLGNSNFEIQSGTSSSSGRGINSSVFLTKDKIVAGDAYFGYHCFDLQREFLYTIVEKQDIPDYNIRNNRVSVKIDTSTDRIVSFSMLDECCIFFKVINRSASFYFHDFRSRKSYLTRPGFLGSTILIAPDKYVGFSYNPAADKQYPFMYSFNIEGDTLCRFMNYNPLPETTNKGRYTNPETSDFYHYNGRLTVRQAYNDTIYRVDINRLTPAFILNTGSKKADVQTALRGNKQGKIFINTLLETDDFLFLIHTEDYDCPNNRNSGAVKFFYSYFDKKGKKRYSIPSGLFPEVFTLKNSIPNTIPLLVKNARVYNDKLYAGYTKIQLKEIIESQGFSSFPKIQQEKMQELYNDLSDYELLIMVLKR